jgi:NAD(P)-dependent dehydrogenase (short-subunit alcohol dehydrogenase family)
VSKAKTPSRQILVTGVSRGLGLALVEGFVELGHRVWGCARSARQIEILRDRFGPPHDFCTIDVADAGLVEDWARRAAAAGFVPDLLINNAAVVNANAPLWQVSAADFADVIRVNVIGTFHVLRSFLPAMVERSCGVIANMSSGWGRSTSPDVAPYCASKWAIEGLTQALSQDLPPGMAAVPVNPGIINTQMLQSCFGEAASSYPVPGDWAARAVPFLLKLSHRDNGRPLSVPE